MAIENSSFYKGARNFLLMQLISPGVKLIIWQILFESGNMTESMTSISKSGTRKVLKNTFTLYLYAFYSF